MVAIDRLGGLASETTLGIKAPCLVATTANITLSGIQTIDGVSVGNAAERVLVKNQTTQTQNGIYIANSGTWTLAPDAAGNTDWIKGTQVYVSSGVVNGGTIFAQTCTDIPIVIGTSSLTFIRLPVAGSTLSVTTGLTAAPAALGGTQRPVNLFTVTSDNIATDNIEGLMSFYVFGGPQMTGNRFASYDFIYNTAITANTFGQYCGTYGEAYTFLGDGGTGGSPRGAWFGGNFSAHLDNGSGTGTFSAQGAEFDTIVHSAAQAKYVMGITVVGSNAAHAATMETAIAIGGSDIGNNIHLGWNKILTLTDLHDRSPVNANTIFFDTYWTGGGTKAIKTWANLVGLTGSDFILNSTNISIDWSGTIITNGNLTGGAWTGSGAQVILNGSAISAGGTAGFGYRFSTTANFGTFFGSGAPTLSAAQGSLYLRSDGLPYYNTNGSTGWGSLAPLASPTFTGTPTFPDAGTWASTGISSAAAAGIGTALSASAFLAIAAGTTAKSQINFAASTAPTSPNNGDWWFDGTNLNIRIAGSTKTITHS